MWKREHATWRGRRWSWFEAGQGPALVFLHGGGGTGKSFAHQMDGLENQVRVICPDMPGFGQSEFIDGVWTAEAIAGVVLEWMACIGVDRFVLGGNSMGGRVALAIAISDPGRIRGLILLDALGVIVSDVPIQNPLDLPPEQFVDGLVYDRARYRRRTPYRTVEDAGELHRGRASFAAYLAHDPIAKDRRDQLRLLRMPVLAIWGRQDGIIPLAYGKELVQGLPDAELVTIDECGHLPHEEQPEVVNTLIKDFLDRRVSG